jgi:hypothetical protein
VETALIVHGAAAHIHPAKSLNCHLDAPGRRARLDNGGAPVLARALCQADSLFPCSQMHFSLLRRIFLPVAAKRFRCSGPQGICRQRTELPDDLAWAGAATGPDSKSSLLFSLFSGVARATLPSL